MERGKRIARTFLVTLATLLVLCALVRWIVGPGEPGVMRTGENGGPAIPPGISDSLWAIMATFLFSIALGMALMVSGGQLTLRAVGSVLLGTASAMAVMYAIEVTAFPWNTYEVTWGHLIDFWGLFYGGFAAVSVFGLAHALAPKRHAGSTFGLNVAGVALGILGVMTLWWAAMWGLPVFSLEGGWIYPMALFSLLFSFLAFRRVRRAPQSDERVQVIP